MRALVVALLLLACSAQANVTASLGTGMVFEYANDGQTWETRQPLSVRAGYRFMPIDVFMEYSTFHVAQGTSMVTVGRNHHEWSAWAKKRLPIGWPVIPFVAAGAGLQYDEVELSLDRRSTRESGETGVVLGALAGIDVPVWRKIDVQFESRLAVSSSYSPNPLFGLGLFVGLRF